MMRRILIALWIAFPGLASAAVLITDAVGKAEVDGAGRLTLLAEMRDGSRLRLQAGARVVGVDLASGREYVLTGPGVYVVEAAGLKTVQGAPAQASELPVAGLPNARAAARSVAQASIVMRSARLPADLTLISPVRTAVLRAAPTLRWSGVAGADLYRVAVTDQEDGSIVLSRETAQASLEIEQPSPLAAGRRYRWRVEALLGERAIAEASASFNVLASETSATLARLEETSGDSFARRVLYAAQLQEAGAVEEARAAWRELASQRPDDRVLQALAR
jgi:hypothetical protein